MKYNRANDPLQQPVASVAHRNVMTLRQDLTAQEAMEEIRKRDIGERIIYFYIVDEEDRLVGVLPTRNLLTAAQDRRMTDIMIKKAVAIPGHATVEEACEFFVMYKFLAFPVVDEQRRVLGVVDIELFTDEFFDITERDRMNQVFESIGFRVSQVRDASPIRAFRYRFPWLLATMASGLLCAIIAGIFETTLQESIVLAIFITLALALGESVSMQSMTMAIQSLRVTQPTLRWYLRSLSREIGAALLLALACGALIGIIVLLWRHDATAALAIGVSVVLAVCMACLLGLSIPTMLHAFRLDPKVAAGPVTLAITDVSTLLFYFGLGALLL